MPLPTLPNTQRQAIPAAALVITHLRLKVHPMFAQLDAACPGTAIADIRLLPVEAVDFYAWKKP